MENQDAELEAILLDRKKIRKEIVELYNLVITNNEHEVNIQDHNRLSHIKIAFARLEHRIQRWTGNCLRNSFPYSDGQEDRYESKIDELTKLFASIE